MKRSKVWKMATAEPIRTSPADDTDDIVFEVFYDGDCPLCMREIGMLERMDKRGRIKFTDIVAPEFSAEEVGVEFDKLMARIHGRLPDGTIVEGVEVFRHLYTAVGWTWPVALSRLPVVRGLLDMAYTLFAKNRLRFTGRCSEGECAVN